MTAILSHTPFSLRGVRSMIKKEYGHGHKQQAKQAIEPTCTPAPYILHNEASVSGGKKPVPIQHGGQHGDDAGQSEYALYEVLACHDISPLPKLIDVSHLLPHR